MFEEPVLVRYVRTWASTYELIKLPELLMPLLAVCVVRLLILVLVWFFWVPGLSGVLAPVLGSLAGDGALHFPKHVSMFPVIVQVVDAFILLTFGMLFYACAVFMATDAVEGELDRPVTYLGEVTTRTPPILVLGLLFVIGAMIVPLVLNEVADLLYQRPKAQFLVIWFAVGVRFVVLVLFAYSLVFLRKFRSAWRDALARSIRFARQELALTSLIVWTVFILRWPLVHLGDQTSVLLTTGRSHWVLIYLFLSVLADIGILFYLFASTTSVALEKHHRRASPGA